MKLSDKLAKVNDSLSLNRFDNGYMVEVSGNNADDEWVTSKILCSSLEEVITLLKEYSSMKLN